MKLHTLTLSSGDKQGAIFSLDVALAILLMVIVLASAAYYTASAEEAARIKQMQRIGYDVVSVLNYLEYFHTRDNLTVHEKALNVTPDAYNIKLNITGNFPGPSLVTNSTIDYNLTVISGAIPIQIYNKSTQTRYAAVARFYLWPN